jgi:MFS transporter, ACDE family, multidrug resistance protein
MTASHGAAPSPFKQPRAVWAVAFACVISFMGIGLVDPILPALATSLHATPSQVSLLFTSYLVVTAVAMLVVGRISSRIGAKRTLVVGLILIVVFAALAGTSDSIGGIVGFRAGWAWATPCSSRPALPSSWPRPAAASPERSSCTRPR